MTQSKQFIENYHGILCHDGWIRVAKFNITAKILNIQGNNKILVKGNGRQSYPCMVHKNLHADVKYMSKGDTAGIKWNRGKPYIVGYRKSSAKDEVAEPDGDKPVSENMDWITFFRRIDAE